jgi:hypothetical protein
MATTRQSVDVCSRQSLCPTVTRTKLSLGIGIETYAVQPSRIVAAVIAIMTGTVTPTISAVM